MSLLVGDGRRRPEQLIPCDGGRDGERSTEGNNSWVIDPQESQFSHTWDLVVMVLMLYTATVTPFEVRFVLCGRLWLRENERHPTSASGSAQGKS